MTSKSKKNIFFKKPYLGIPIYDPPKSALFTTKTPSIYISNKNISTNLKNVVKNYSPFEKGIISYISTVANSGDPEND